MQALNLRRAVVRGDGMFVLLASLSMLPDPNAVNQNRAARRST